MTSKSKNKGNKLEREISTRFNEAFKCEEFARTPSSGAIMGLSNAKKNAGLNHQTKQTLGSDLICPEWFKFSVECKNYSDTPNYAKIIKDDDKVLNKWLGEALFDAKTLVLSPMLVFRTNRKGTHIAIPSITKLPVDITHYLYYNGFWILGMDYFVENIAYFNDENTKSFSTIQNWIDNDSNVKDLIESMLEVKSK